MLFAGVARAQITVAVTVSGTQNTTPGSTVNAGQFSITNTPGTVNESVTSISFSISNASLFSAMTLTATGSDSTVQSVSVPLQASGTVTFPVAVAVNLNQPAATFSLSATVAGGATPTTTSNSGSIAFASLLWPHRGASSRTTLAIFGLFAIGMLWMDGRLKRRHLVALAIVMALAATEVGCGNCSGSIFGCSGSNSGVGSSDQQITAVGATPTTSLSGVPADLGTITSQ